MTWKVAGPHIVSENIEEEVIVVDLVEGSYFSITGCGTEIWQLIQSGYSKDQMIEMLASHFNTPAETLSQQVDQFTESLLAESLIKPQPTADVMPARPLSKQGSPFVAALLRKFTDMEDVLKMDPIHDFDELGWPNKVPV